MDILLGISVVLFSDYINDDFSSFHPDTGEITFVYYKTGDKIFRKRFQVKTGMCGSGYCSASWCHEGPAVEVTTEPEYYTYTPKKEMLITWETVRDTYSGDTKRIHAALDGEDCVLIEAALDDGGDSYYPHGDITLHFLEVTYMKDYFHIGKSPEEVVIHFFTEDPPKDFFWKAYKNLSFQEAIALEKDPNFPIRFEGLTGPYDEKILVCLREGYIEEEGKEVPLTVEHKLAFWWMATPGSLAEKYASGHVDLEGLKAAWLGAASSSVKSPSNVLGEISPYLHSKFEEKCRTLIKPDDRFQDYYTNHDFTNEEPEDPGIYRVALVHAFQENANSVFKETPK